MNKPIKEILKEVKSHTLSVVGNILAKEIHMTSMKALFPIVQM